MWYEYEPAPSQSYCFKPIIFGGDLSTTSLIYLPLTNALVNETHPQEASSSKHKPRGVTKGQDGRRQCWSTGIIGHRWDRVQQKVSVEKFMVMYLELKRGHAQRKGAKCSKIVGWKIESIALVNSQLTGRNCHNPAAPLIEKNASRELWQMKSMSVS
jgi:hypothetical protein